MAFDADSSVLLVLVITAEFLSVFFFSAKCLFLLKELNHMEDVGLRHKEVVSLF